MVAAPRAPSASVVGAPLTRSSHLPAIRARMRPDRTSAQIRATLEQLIADSSTGVSWASLSRMLRRPPGWLRYLAVNDRLHLIPADERGRLARFFDIDEWELGGPGEARAIHPSSAHLRSTPRYRSPE